MCLPSLLVALAADGLATNVVLQPLPLLESLSICWCEGQVCDEFWSQLGMLPCLTALYYVDKSYGPLPRQISTLTTLRRLDLAGPSPHVLGTFFAPLLPLCNLSYLRLCDCCLTAMPANIYWPCPTSRSVPQCPRVVP